MEIIDTKSSQFVSLGMIPESDDVITIDWTRKIVKNIFSGYGIIGTFHMDGICRRDINLQLTKIFAIPPMVRVYFKTVQEQYFLQSTGDFPIRNSTLIIGADGYYVRNRNLNCYGMINGDMLSVFSEHPDVEYAFFRINGI